MANIGLFCENVMGLPPCSYTIVGMGSLARKEITPYSCFKHILLLSDDRNSDQYLEYFRWYSVKFHIVILNIQETIIPCLDISCFNGTNYRLDDWFYDFVTPNGISFDSMMLHPSKFPLGRMQSTKNKQFSTKLIKPVSKMLLYLSSETNLKHGYHLADLITKTCFVFGNEDIYEQFTLSI